MSDFEIVLCFSAAVGLTIMILIYAYLQYLIKKRWEEVKRLV
jgi:xanthine/uracil/vitamin C permease (AzgA family)